MNKKLYIGIIISILAVSVPLASEENQFFVSGGFVNAISDYKENSPSSENLKVNFDFNYGLGVNSKFGYSIQDFFSFGLDMEFIGDPNANYEHDDAYSIYIDKKHNSDKSKTLMETNLCKILFSLMPFIKISLPGKYKPYLYGGAGKIYQHSHMASSITYYNENKTIFYSDASIDESKTDYAFCTKGGLGFEFKSTEWLSLWVDGCYVSGLGDLDYIRYYTATLGFSVYF
jgi:hypothetical protein